MQQVTGIQTMVVFSIRRMGEHVETLGVVVPDGLADQEAAAIALPTLRSVLPEAEGRTHDLYLPRQIFFEAREDDHRWSVPEIFYRVVPVLTAGARHFLLDEVASIPTVAA